MSQRLLRRAHGPRWTAAAGLLSGAAASRGLAAAKPKDPALEPGQGKWIHPNETEEHHDADSRPSEEIEGEFRFGHGGTESIAPAVVTQERDDSTSGPKTGASR